MALDVRTKGLLVKVSSEGARGFAAARTLGAFEPILEVPAGTPSAMGIAAPAPATWVRIESADKAWDHAHALMAGGYGAADTGVLAAEPDLEQNAAEPDASPAENACQPGAAPTCRPAGISTISIAGWGRRAAACRSSSSAPSP